MHEHEIDTTFLERSPNCHANRLDSNDRQSAVPSSAGVLLMVEGYNDIQFLRRISRILHLDDATVPDLNALEELGRLIFVPFGGGCLDYWSHRMSALAWHEFHLYDREMPPETKLRRQAVKIVNTRVGCRAVVTSKRSLENYLNSAAIEDVKGVQVEFSDDDSVPDVVARACLPPRCKWEDLSRTTQKRLRNRAKKWLNTGAADQMTRARLDKQDPRGELIAWLSAIARLATDHDRPK